MLFAVGSYTSLGGPGVAVIRAEGTKLAFLCASREVTEPTWVMQAPKHPHILYAACGAEGTKEGIAASFFFSQDGLTLLSAQPTGGRACCHLAVDEEEKNLYAANYLDGSVSVFPLTEEGKIGPRSQFLRHIAPTGPNPVRQECSHAHQCVFRPGTQELFVCNLGTDQVLIYARQADGTLRPQSSIQAQPGTGPRHLAFDGPCRFYLAGELGGWLSVYQLQEGKWQCLQLLPTVPGGFQGENTAAAIRLDEKRAYVSNRGHDSIALFDRGADGLLTPVGHVAVPGCFPRDFRLWAGGFLLAQQKRGGVAWMDAQGQPGESLALEGAVCLCPLK